jgi:hypothetical protein
LRTSVRTWAVVSSIAGSWLAVSACELVVGKGDYSTGDAGLGASSGASGSGSSGASGSGSGSSGASGSGSSGVGASSSGSSGASGSSGVGASSSGSSGGTCTFPAGATCSVDPQCGCPAGQKCDIGGTAAAACTTAGSGTQGARCALNTDCAAGLTCVDGVCHSYCESVGAACPGGLCVQGGNGAQPQDKICTIDCKLQPDTCGAGEACLPITVGGVLATADCEAPGTGAYGDSCQNNVECGAGLGCDSPTGSGTYCLPWCQSDANCAVGYTCFPFSPAETIDGISYGYCD